MPDAMSVSKAVAERYSARAFKADPVSGETVRAILEAAARAPSGGNLQPWKVHAVGGEALADFKARVAARLGSPDEAQYAVYPANLWEPFRSRRFQVGEDLYGALEIPREDKIGRLRQFARNAEFFGRLRACLPRIIADGRMQQQHFPPISPDPA